MIVHSYKTESGRDLIMEYIDSLPEEEQAEKGIRSIFQKA